MSSMWRAAVILPVILAAAPCAARRLNMLRPHIFVLSTLRRHRTSPQASIASWRLLRQSSYSLLRICAILNAYRDWPDESKMRAWAERAMRPGGNPATVMAFFLYDKPKTGNGWARLADAYAASGRSADALAAAKMPGRGRSQRHGRAEPMGPLRRSFLRDDQDRRADALLFAKQPQDAARFLTATRPATSGGVCCPDRDAERFPGRRCPIRCGDRHRDE